MDSKASSDCGCSNPNFIILLQISKDLRGSLKVLSAPTCRRKRTVVLSFGRNYRLASAKKMNGNFILKNPIAFVLMILSLCCILIILITTLRLPELTVGVKNQISITRKVPKDDQLGKFGEMMIKMLPKDLAFTVFVPSEKAIERELSLRVNESLTAEKMDDTYAVISRVLGFSAVPQTIHSTSVDYGNEISYDAVSGFTLYISKDRDGRLIVNRMKSEMVDIKKKDVVVHIMDGVIMDAEFEQSVKPDGSED